MGRPRTPIKPGSKVVQYNMRYMPLACLDKARIRHVTHKEKFPTIEAYVIEAIRRGTKDIEREIREEKEAEQS